MKKFKYIGYTAQGAKQVGTLEAENYTEAYAALNYQGITVIKLEEIQTDLATTLENFYLKMKLSGQWQGIFFRQLSVMLGVMTLHESLKVLTDAAKNHPSQKILSGLHAAVGEGQNLSAALSRYDIIFGGDAIQSVEIGERSGNLQEVTAQLARQTERNYETEKKVRGAMYYPIFVLLAALIAMVVLVNVTLPVFENFFAQQGGNLPTVTLILLYGGRFMSRYWFLILILLTGGIIGGIYLLRKFTALKMFADKMKLTIKLLRETELRNFFGRLAFLLESGVTLDEAVKLCADATKNLHVKNILEEVKFSVERGATLSDTLAEKNMPSLYIGLIVTGETGGELVNMLRQCETMADFEVEEILRTLPAKAEIFGTLLAGIIVATLAFAVILPILDTTNLL
ncbi:MAG: type II secretion system F family protein [Selenomonadaceae bacterium]|nr:type II secretion system F family protein [Selenomonadaceae bacterium]